MDRFRDHSCCRGLIHRNTSSTSSRFSRTPACHFAGYDVDRNGARIAITIWNERLSQVDIACAAVVGETETAIALGSDFERGTTYQVTVNAETPHTFTTQ